MNSRVILIILWNRFIHAEEIKFLLSSFGETLVVSSIISAKSLHVFTNKWARSSQPQSNSPSHNHSIKENVLLFIYTFKYFAIGTLLSFSKKSLSLKEDNIVSSASQLATPCFYILIASKFAS